MFVRRETPEDHAAVHAVHRAAFAREAEAALVDALRTDGDLVGALSFVAVHGGHVVGHVCGSRARLGADTGAAVGLGPLGVLPAHQRAGVGSALAHTVLGAADALGHGLAVLLGDPDYYTRFGFVPASDFGVTPPDPQWAPHFQVRPLAGHRSTHTGAFAYAPAFSRL